MLNAASINAQHVLSRRQVVHELSPCPQINGYNFRIFDCIAKNDISIANQAYREDLEKLRIRCRKPDLVIFCTPLIPRKVSSEEEAHRIRNNDSKTIDFYYRTQGKEFFSKCIFILTGEVEEEEASQDLERRIEYLHSRLCNHMRKEFVDNNVKFIYVPNTSESSTWKDKLLMQSLVFSDSCEKYYDED